MTAHKKQSRLLCRFWGIALSGLLLLVILFVWLIAEGKASGSRSNPASSGSSGRQGAVELPGKMDPMDVVRTVDRNRGGISLETSSPGSFQTPDELGPPFHIGGEPVYGQPEANDQRWPSVAFDSTNYLVLWADERNGTWNIYGARVNESGVVLDSVGIAFSTAVDDQTRPTVAFDGTNYLVVWVDDRNGSGDIYGAQVSVGGIVLDPSGIAISTAANQQWYPRLVFDGTNYLVVWQDGVPGSNFDIYGARVDIGGIVLDPAGIPIATAAATQQDPALAFDGTNYLVSWKSGSECGVRETRVSVGGVVLDPTGIAISTEGGYQDHADIDSATIMVTEYGGNLHPGAGGVYSLFNTQLSIETSLDDSDFFMRVMIPFTSLDLGGENPFALDLIYYDPVSEEWVLAVEGNTVNSPGCAGPVGDRYAIQDTTVPALSSDLGDYGMFWNDVAEQGFVWANVDHCTDFAAGLDTTRTGIDDPGADTPSLPKRLRFLHAAPNPFNPMTTISFFVPTRSEVTLEIFDVAGRVVRTFNVGHVLPGENSVQWFGKNDSGQTVASGVYLIRVCSGREVDTGRVVFLK
jgi:hypothetical protein